MALKILIYHKIKTFFIESEYELEHNTASCALNVNFLRSTKVEFIYLH